jgi:hypothetical protein
MRDANTNAERATEYAHCNANGNPDANCHAGSYADTIRLSRRLYTITYAYHNTGTASYSHFAASPNTSTATLASASEKDRDC